MSHHTLEEISTPNSQPQTPNYFFPCTIFSESEGFSLLRPHICPLCLVGISSPSNFPQGLNPSTRSKMILRMATKGMDKNIPETPHIAPPNKTRMIENSALICTLEETIFGTRKLLSMN